MKKRSSSKFSIKPLICLFMLALTIIITASVTVHAAGKKTVRVTTQQELIDAINNSSVGTIVLRTETQDPITIPSNKNAKSKKLIVDANCSVITNKAKFKSISIEGASHFTEAVSGNTIEIPTYYLYKLELAKKKSIKKLVLTGYTGFEECNMFCTIRKGAKIKNIVVKSETDGTVAINKSTRTLSYHDEAFEWGEPADVVMTFDKSGRILNRTEDFDYENDVKFTYKYDKNGNLLESRGYVYYEDSDEPNEAEVNIYTYDKKNRVKTASEQGRYSLIVTYTSFYYDGKGRLIREAGEDNNGGESIREYTYDSKGRLQKILYEDQNESSVTEYEYNDKGYVVSEKYTSTQYDNYALSTYEYDKYGNCVKTINTDFYGGVSTSEVTYDELGNWIKSVWTTPDGEVYVSEPGMAG